MSLLHGINYVVNHNIRILLQDIKHKKNIVSTALPHIDRHMAKQTRIDVEMS
uniref:Uncharacterized protein n=1 Tax=Arundo donax TaxID=35708 RepID=A0A0A9C3F9_ARUDO